MLLASALLRAHKSGAQSRQYAAAASGKQQACLLVATLNKEPTSLALYAGLQARYDQLVASGSLQADARQAACVQTLHKLSAELATYAEVAEEHAIKAAQYEVPPHMHACMRACVLVCALICLGSSTRNSPPGASVCLESTKHGRLAGLHVWLLHLPACSSHLCQSTRLPFQTSQTCRMMC